MLFVGVLVYAMLFLNHSVPILIIPTCSMFQLNGSFNAQQKETANTNNSSKKSFAIQQQLK